MRGVWHQKRVSHHTDIIMGAMASQITRVSTVYSTVCWGVDQRKHQSSASLAFVRGIHRWLLNSPHKGSVTRKMFPSDDVFMKGRDEWLHPTDMRSVVMLYGIPCYNGSRYREPRLYSGLTHWGRVTHICVSINHHWFRYWLVAWSAPSHYLNQWLNIVNWTIINKFHWISFKFKNSYSKKYIWKCCLQNGGQFVSA